MRKLYGLGLSAVLCVAMLSASAQIQTRSPFVYAYTTNDHLIVMRDATVVSNRPYKPASKYVQPTWTVDHRYLAVVEDVAEGDPPDGELRHITVIDSADGSTHELPCRWCKSLAAIGGSLVLADQETLHAGEGDTSLETVLRVDVASADPPVQLTTKLPTLRYGQFLAGGDGRAFFFGYEQDGQQEDYYVMGPDGRSTLIARRRLSTRTDETGKRYLRGIGAIAPIMIAGADPVFAVPGHFERQGNQCGSSSELYVLGHGAEPVRIDISRFTPASSGGRDTATTVGDAWWGVDHKLHAIVLAGICDNTDSYTTPPSEWRLIDGSWQKASPDYVYHVAELSPDSRLVIRGAKATTGKGLFLMTAEHEILIDRKALDVYMPPAGSTLPSRSSLDLCSPSDNECPTSARASTEAGVQAPATARVVLSPVKPDGRPVTAYAVSEEGGTTVECDYSSPLALDRHVISCSPSAASADACWVAAQPAHVLCLRDPWEKRLVDLSTIGRPEESSAADYAAIHPVPIGLELSDGDRCRARNGGAWDSQEWHPNYVGYYSCTKHQAVWGDRTSIDMTTSAWKVKVGDANGSLITRGVVKAYFVATAR
jgi:hypothetical protein